MSDPWKSYSRSDSGFDFSGEASSTWIAPNVRQIRRATACWLVVIGVLSIHTAIVFSGGVDALGWVYEMFGLSRSGIFSGKIWQILSYAWLHGAWWHVGLNALFLLLVGSKIEHIAGRAVVVRVILWGVLGGGCFHLLAGSGILVGLSGGALALLLLLTTLSPDSRMFPLSISARSLGLGIFFTEGMLTLVDPTLALPLFSPLGKMLRDQGFGGLFEMGNACHFGGALAGMLYGKWLLRPRITLDRLRRNRARREAGGL